MMMNKEEEKATTDRAYKSLCTEFYDLTARELPRKVNPREPSNKSV